MLDLLTAVQRGLHTLLTDRIGGFAQTRNLAVLVSMLPFGIAFGTVHALTPGHGKTVLAGYLVGSRLAPLRSLAVSGALTVTHIGSAVLLAIAGAPILSRMFGMFGRAPTLERASHLLLIGLGLWILVRAMRGRSHAHDQRDGVLVGVSAGLVPCPLTLFAMMMAIGKGVPEAGLTFALAMTGGVGLTLGVVALAALAAGRWMQERLNENQTRLRFIGRALDIGSGVALVGLALYGLLHA